MRIAPVPATCAAALAALASLACQPAPGPGLDDVAPAEVPAARSDAYVVDIVAEDYAFQAPDEIPSGWITLRMANEGEETHFVYLTRLAEGRSYDQYVQEVGAPISEIMAAMRAGELDKPAAGEQLGARIPAWYWTDAVAMGGPGLVAPGGVSQATVHLEPGTYVMECYMKTPEGELHWMEGMIRPLTVTAQEAGAPEPAADVEIVLEAGDFRVSGPVSPGLHTVAVRFLEQPDIGFGNDIHVVRLTEGLSGAELIPWMDFLNVEGLENPAPAPFVGGVQERPEGHTAYFTVELEPGRYAWISESADVRELVQEFTVRH